MKPVLPFSLPTQQLPKRPGPREADVEKQEAIKEAFKHSWDAYRRDAWGDDEYHPLSRGGSNLTAAGGIGYTIVDSLDTLLIMGLQEEYNEARDWVKDEMTIGRDGKFNVFEVSTSRKNVEVGEKILKSLELWETRVAWLRCLQF